MSCEYLNITTKWQLNKDVLALLVFHLDRRSLTAFSLTSSYLHSISTAYLYHTLDVRPACNPLLAADKSHNLSDRKKAAINHTEVINLFEHNIANCPGLHEIPELKNLHTLHLAGGGQTISDLKKGACRAESCKFISETCKRAKVVISRTIGTEPQARLPLLPDLQRVILKLRICQLPMYHSRSDRMPVWARKFESPFGTFSSAKQLDLVLWDERHQHRLERIYHHPFIMSNSKRQPIALRKGCVYCDQKGCIFRPNEGPTNLSDLMWEVGRWSDTMVVKTFNVGRSARLQPHTQTKASLEEVEREIVNAYKQGRQVRQKDGKDDNKGEERTDEVSITFHSDKEYYELASAMQELHQFDPGEKEYWDLVIHPSQEVIKLREAMGRETSFEFEEFEGCGKSWLEKVLQDHRDGLYCDPDDHDE